jgi:type I restriction-modification system DNA methylase subunit
MARGKSEKQNGGANFGFEQTLWAAADKLRGPEYKHVVLGLIFPKYIANPPFKMSDWGGDRLRDDSSWEPK